MNTNYSRLLITSLENVCCYPELKLNILSIFLPFNRSHRGWWPKRVPNLSASWTSAGTTTRSRRLPNSTASWFWRSSRRWSSSRRSRTATSQLRLGLASTSSRKHLPQAGEGRENQNNVGLPVNEQIFFYWFVQCLMWSGECERVSRLNVTFLPGKNDPNPNIRHFSICLFLLISTMFI